MTQPNILMIMTDQQRWDTLACCGNPVVETVNLDWIASEGTVFHSAYSPVPACVPARACLISGMNQWNTGILGMGRGQGPMGGGFLHTLPGELAQAGYHTQLVGKMHFYPQRSLNGFHGTVLDEEARVEDPGFVSDYKAWFDQHKTGDYDIVDHGIGWNSWMARPYHAPEWLHPSNWTVNESIRFLKRRDPNRPFFLLTSFARPHSPFDPPPWYFDLYMQKEIPGPRVGAWASVHDAPADAAHPEAWRGVRSGAEIRRARAAYYGLIHHIDHQIGRLLAFLGRIGELDNTMIVFTSDHGDMLGDNNLWNKTHAYEGSAHVPLLVRLPRSGSAVRHVYEPAILYDIMPTILDAAGADIPAAVDGRSLMPLIRGEDVVWREYVHGEHCTLFYEQQEMQYVTDGNIKYIWFPKLGTEQLFDLRTDPYEEHNLAGNSAFAAELSVWRSRLVRELETRGCGLTDGDRLVNQAGKPAIVSPHYKTRLDRTRMTHDMLKSAAVTSAYANNNLNNL